MNGGAVAYLTHSPYGRNGNEISVNNSKRYYTGRSAGAPGSDTTSTSETGTYKYNTINGMLASTTGNITGIYDMSGGDCEYVAAWNTNSTSSCISDYGSSFANTGEMSTKYATAYKGNTSNFATSSKCILGDATYEVCVSPGGSRRAWFNDYCLSPTLEEPFYMRGGPAGYWGYDGVFYSNITNSGSETFRVSLPGI